MIRKIETLYDILSSHIDAILTVGTVVFVVVCFASSFISK